MVRSRRTSPGLISYPAAGQPIQGPQRPTTGYPARSGKSLRDAGTRLHNSGCPPSYYTKDLSNQNWKMRVPRLPWTVEVSTIWRGLLASRVKTYFQIRWEWTPAGCLPHRHTRGNSRSRMLNLHPNFPARAQRWPRTHNLHLSSPAMAKGRSRTWSLHLISPAMSNRHSRIHNLRLHLPTRAQYSPVMTHRRLHATGPSNFWLRSDLASDAARDG